MLNSSSVIRWWRLMELCQGNIWERLGGLVSRRIWKVYACHSKIFKLVEYIRFVPFSVALGLIIFITLSAEAPFNLVQCDCFRWIDGRSWWKMDSCEGHCLSGEGCISSDAWTSEYGWWALPPSVQWCMTKNHHVVTIAHGLTLHQHADDCQICLHAGRQGPLSFRHAGLLPHRHRCVDESLNPT